VPAFILKWLIGDFSELFLFSQKVCSRKIEKLGFHFQVKNITSFLKKNKKKWQ
jgi:NAD dependent epimerase/dehydratase family enzyme